MMRNRGKRVIISGMRSNLIQGLFACSHQFSWPRCDDAGEHYQICVRCGAKYSYDWERMRRVAPLENRAEEVDAGRSPIRKCGVKKAWVPRERRLRHSVPVQFRVSGSDEWLEGVTENISRTGLLFRGGVPLEVGCSLELILEMPREVAGEDGVRVVCEGSLVRVEATPAMRKCKNPTFRMACSITMYRFIFDGEHS
jgi:hypothetical protein